MLNSWSGPPGMGFYFTLLLLYNVHLICIPFFLVHISCFYSPFLFFLPVGDSFYQKVKESSSNGKVRESFIHY